MCHLWAVVIQIQVIFINLFINGKMRFSIIDSDLLYRGAFYGTFDCTFVQLIKHRYQIERARCVSEITFINYTQSYIIENFFASKFWAASKSKGHKQNSQKSVNIVFFILKKSSVIDICISVLSVHLSISDNMSTYQSIWLIILTI